MYICFQVLLSSRKKDEVMLLLPESLLSWLPRQWHRRGLRKKRALFGVCKRSNRPGLLQERHSFFQDVASWFCCAVVSFTDWKHLAFHQPCVLRRRAVLAEVNSPDSYLTHLVDPDMISWGHFWGWIVFPAVQLFPSILPLPLEESGF